MLFSKNNPGHSELKPVVTSGKVVEVDYTIHDDNGEVLDSTADSMPLLYVHGGTRLLSGLQKALEGKSAGDTVEVVLTPDQAYGERNPARVETLEKPLFDNENKTEKGMQYEVPTIHGLRLVTVVSVESHEVTVDMNHPLAGKTLHINATIASIRDAEYQELEEARR
jgi:FKBP-type peptidyl-prolyl cis-trans isomerase SlyD